jgi:molybdenum cofactor guanylyltransferase
MKILAVTGATSKTGKTALIRRLIPLLPGWAVCKVTTCFHHPGGICPRGQEDTCGICNTLDAPYLIIEDPAVIQQTGTDTGKYAEAGAVRVIWVESRPESLAEAIPLVLDRLKDYPGIIFEGNHVLQHIDADFSVMMAGNGSRFKKSAEAVRDRVSLAIYNWDFDAAVKAVLERFAPADRAERYVTDEGHAVPERLTASAVILTGGRGARMGQKDKSLLTLAGETFLQRKLRLLAPIFSEIIISVSAAPLSHLLEQVSSDPEAGDTPIRIVKDGAAGIGPLMGIAAALEAAAHELIFVSSVDAPFTSLQLVRYLVDGIGTADAHVPIWNGYPEPLFAVYRRSCLAAIQGSIAAEQRRIISFYDEVTVRYAPEEVAAGLDAAGRSFININTWEEYERWS